jgi:hypothetical protein
MRRTLRPEAVAVLGERRVPSLLQNLQQRLLDQSIDDTGDAEFSDTAVGFRYLYPPDWLRPVGSAEQLRPDIWPMLTQVTLGIFDGHPIDARSAFVASHALPRAHEVFSFAHLFHEMHRCCRAFGLRYRHARFGPGVADDRGFTPASRRPVRLLPIVLPRSAHKMPVLLATPNRSGLRPSFLVRPFPRSAFWPKHRTGLADSMAYYAPC